MTLRDLLRDVDTVVALEPEELGGQILAYANSATYSERETILYKGFQYLINPSDVPAEKRGTLAEALLEAWQWLEREGLIIQRVYSRGYNVTRRGQRIHSPAAAATYSASRALPRELLHPQLVQRVWSAVLRADYETAVFQAFREVEIAVRDAGGYQSSELGVPLMRRAFDKSTGPLSSPSEPEGEREALSHLFAGAIGRFKNPTSHRSVAYRLSEAAEALMLASMLLRIVDERQEAGAAGQQPIEHSTP